MLKYKEQKQTFSTFYSATFEFGINGLFL